MELYNAEPSGRIRLAGAVAEFAMLLKNSEYKADSSFNYVIDTAEEIFMATEDDRVSELAELAAKAQYISD